MNPFARTWPEGSRMIMRKTSLILLGAAAGVAAPSSVIISSQIDEHADPPHALALLRARRERACYRAAECG